MSIKVKKAIQLAQHYNHTTIHSPEVQMHGSTWKVTNCFGLY